MAKQLSTARKFKMITGKDLFQQQKAMDTELKKRRRRNYRCNGIRSIWSILGSFFKITL